MSRIAPPGGPGFKLIAYWVAAVAAMLTCTHTVPAGEETAEASISAGNRIFFGETPLRGVIVGQSEHLPASVVACANCHAAGSPLSSGKPFGPPLNRATLTEPALAPVRTTVAFLTRKLLPVAPGGCRPSLHCHHPWYAKIRVERRSVPRFVAISDGDKR
jgi:mono/diheme cytochrome c family protein